MTDRPVSFDAQYTLDDRYARTSGRVLLTGVQALVRLPLMQHARDRLEGLNTAGFISGYRGSPLGTYDLALWQAKRFLEAAEVHFEPGVNEDLAATAVWGSHHITVNMGTGRYSATTWLRSVPIPEISISTVSPGLSQRDGSNPAAAPDGLPVEIRSPGRSAQNVEM